MKKVSAVIANWNGSHHLKKCLPSILDQSYDNLEVIVVDNNSHDNSKEIVQKFDARWVPLEKNEGLAAALNRGAEVSEGDLLLFLNNDMRFDKYFVKEMVSTIGRNKNIFSVDAVQYSWDGGEKVHLATFINEAFRKESISADRVESKIGEGIVVTQHDVDREVETVYSSAANMMVNKNVFSSLGGFDERMTAGSEDVDICFRAWAKGYKTVFQPSAICYHRVGGSSKSKEGKKMRYRGTIEGGLIFATKLLPLFYIITTLGRRIGGGIKDAACLRGGLVKRRSSVFYRYSRSLRRILEERSIIYRNEDISLRQLLDKLIGLKKKVKK
ncbi:hypothetical protein GGP62_003224 [Salinibacter ruber]|uniref:glycosyltransferase family 2 protein n=1 Tax=Salinibacter ruber TaxID=146919 RepID=UPI00216824B8|nr:glycosyltransferase family 2 protein [Salinibacter ruber]MCS3708314.1 hypothetical protein [Salinibacter ruber]